MKLLLGIPTKGLGSRGRDERPNVQRKPLQGLCQLLIGVAAVAGVLSAAVVPGGAAASASTAAPNNQFQFSAEPYAAAGAQQRSQFAYEVLSGHRLLDQLVIKNVSPTDETFLVYGEDATNSQNGGFGFENRALMHNTVVGKWLTVGSTQVTVPVGKEIVDTFALTIPANAPPGDHVGAVVAEELKGPAQGASGGVNLVLRIAVPVYVRVVGKAFPGLTVENLTVFHQSPVIPYMGSSNVAVRFDLVNTGNDILDPTSATVSITGLLSGTIHKYTVHQTGAAQSRANPLPRQMLPGAKLTLTEAWRGIPPFDPLTAAVSAIAIDPSTTQHITTNASAPFWYFPWILVLIVLALVTGVIVFIIRRRRKGIADGVQPNQGSEPENKSDGSLDPSPDNGALESAGI